MPDTTISTTLRESVNIVLANLGETPVNSIASSSSLPLHVSLAINTIEEVSADVQSKGWWFNQQTGGNFDPNANITIVPSNVGDEWSATIPEEARRYITIRAARITQTRLIGSEELQKFSYNEELVSLAILQQAHVRNSNGELTFTAFPSELRNLGIDEVMFLQGNMEEKLAHLRLGTEIANIDKIKAETALLADQEALVAQQTLTELEETSKRAAEKLLVDEQAGLITNQAATELKKALDLVADTTIKGKQGALIDKQALTEVQNALKVVAETSLINDQEALVVKQALTEVARATDLGADTTLKGKQGSLIDNQAATELKQALKLVAETSLIADQEALVAQQALTEAQETTKRTREAELIDAQEALIQKQILTEAEQVAKVQEEVDLLQKQETLVTNQAATELKKALDLVADTTIKGKQGTLIDNQAATELKNALKVVAETSLLNDQEALVVNQAATELKKALDIAADTTLKGKQGSLIDNQAATELKRALDVSADTALKGKQGALIDAQELKTDAETGLTTQQQALTAQQTIDVAADTTLKGRQADLLDSQKTELDAKTAIEATAEKDFYDGVVAGTQATYRDFAAEMRMMGIQESMFQSTPAYKKVELLKDAEKLRTVTATEFGNLTEIAQVNKVMRLIGEPPVLGTTENALASECIRLLRDTDTDLQGRGWYFNTDDDGVITQKPLDETPQKYREYLNVRVAILLTELYPQSGIDIQRLPKMEQELRAYFKDRDFDDASYSVFDNYDVAARLGVNRPHNIF